jgi:tRNA threonylcarbamoyl adenosine modification protein YeaZ
MELIIDTSKKTYLALKQGKRIIDSLSSNIKFQQSEKLLLSIDRLLKKNNLSKNSLQSIIVDRGPGSYTGIRVGVTTANFLALSLNIPVSCQGHKNKDNNKNTFQLPVLPKYLHQPFITKEKSRPS